MNSSPPSRKPERSSRRTVLFVVLGILLFLIVAPLIAYVAWRVQQTSRISARLQAIRAAGLPTSPAELDRYYTQVPDEQNAALLFLEAAQQMARLEDGQRGEIDKELLQVPLSAPLPDGLKATLRQQVADNQTALDLFHKGATRSASRYPLDLTVGFSALLPHLAEVRHGASLLKWAAVHEANAGRPDRAVEHIETSFAVASSLAAEPLLISFLVRSSMNAISCAAVEQTLSRGTFDDAQLSRLARTVAACEDTNAIVRALAGERASAIPIFRLDPEQIRALGNPGFEGGVPLSGAMSGLGRATGFFDRDLLYYLDLMQGPIDAASQGAQVRADAMKEFDERIINAKTRWYILTGLLAPALAKTLQKDTENLARLRTTVTALAIERYRLGHGGQPPASLAALVPSLLKEVPADPFTGEDLGYRRLKKGYAVFSVGANLKDDRQVEQTPEERRGRGTLDIFIKVER